MASEIQNAWVEQAPYKTALDAAQRLHWSVLPLNQSKKPAVKWKHYQEKAAASHEIAIWQRDFHPTAWAVVTGSVSNLIILDFDGEQGQETLEQLGLQPHLRTGSGGHHIYFHHPGWRVKTLNHETSKDRPWSKMYPGMDIRGDGGYAAFCGRNAKGPYIWLRSPDEPYSLDLLPEDLRALLGLLYAPEPTTEPPSRPQITAVPTRQRTHDQGEYILEKYLSEISMRRGRDNACFEMASNCVIMASLRQKQSVMQASLLIEQVTPIQKVTMSHLHHKRPWLKWQAPMASRLASPGATPGIIIVA